MRIGAGHGAVDEDRLAANPVGEHAEERLGAEGYQVGANHQPQGGGAVNAGDGLGVADGQGAEHGGDGGDERAGNNAEDVAPVSLEEVGNGELGDLGRFLGFLEGRGFVQRAADEERNHNHHGAEPERDAPADAVLDLVREGEDGDEDEGCEDLAALRAGEGPGGEEGAAVVRCVLERHRGGAGLLAGGGEALAEPCQHQQGRSPPAHGIEVGEAADEEGRGAHQQQREHEDLPPAHAVTEVAQDHGTHRPCHVGKAEGGEGHNGRVGAGVREEHRGEDQCRRRTEDEEVVVFDGAAQEAGEGCFLGRPGRGNSALPGGRKCLAHGVPLGVTTLSRMDLGKRSRTCLCWQRAVRLVSVERPGPVATWWELLVRYDNDGCEHSHLSRK